MKDFKKKNEEGYNLPGYLGTGYQYTALALEILVTQWVGTYGYRYRYPGYLPVQVCRLRVNQIQLYIVPVPGPCTRVPEVV
jgi:hypothetical protein